MRDFMVFRGVLTICTGFIHLLTFGGTAAAAEVPVEGFADPEFGHVTQLLIDHVDSTPTTAANLQIRRMPGGEVLDLAVGWLDDAETLPNRLDTPMRIASISKPLTHHAILMLAQEGALRLDASVFCRPDQDEDDEMCVVKTTPRGFDKPPEPEIYTMTIQHLLDHRSGWVQVDPDEHGVTQPHFSPAIVAERLNVSNPPSLADFLDYGYNQPLGAEPGTHYKYSNYGYIMLGHIVERLTEGSLMDYIHDRITRPLGIPDRDFELGHELHVDRDAREPQYISTHPDLRWPNVLDPEGPWVRGPDGKFFIAYAPGGGGMLATTNALLNYAAGHPLGSPETRVHTNFDPRLSHGGMDGTATALGQSLPAHALGGTFDFALLTNHGDDRVYDIRDEVRRAIHNTLKLEQPVSAIEGTDGFDQRMGLYLAEDTHDLRLTFKQHGQRACTEGNTWLWPVAYRAGELVHHHGYHYRAKKDNAERNPVTDWAGDDPHWYPPLPCYYRFRAQMRRGAVPDGASYDCRSEGSEHSCNIEFAPAGMYHVTLTALEGQIRHVTATAHADQCSRLSDWQSTRVYVAGDVIRHQGQRYQARHWTQGDDPIQYAGPWQAWSRLGPCVAGCSAPLYDDARSYATGDTVQHAGTEYRCDVGGWCTLGGDAYAPGVGQYWREAWSETQSCR